MRDCDVTCHKASRMPNGNGFSHSLTNFHKKIHESRETFAYGPSSIRVRPILGLYKFETEKTPRFEPRGDVDTHVFPGLSPEILVSDARLLAPISRVNCLRISSPAAFCPERKGIGDTHENQFDPSHGGTFRCFGNGGAGFRQTVNKDDQHLATSKSW